MRVLATSAAAARLAPLTAMYQLTTGIPIQFDSIATLTQYATVRLRSISNPSVLNLTHEAWLVTASAMGDGLAAGAFADLSHLISLDSRLQWTDMFTQTREAGLIYGRQVIALPLSTYSYQLHYRVDLLAKYNRTVPTTWRQLIQTASQLNGTEGKWGFCGNWGPCALLGTNLVKLVMASMTQTLGGSQGWLIDPDSLQNLVDSPAMMETLDIIKALHRLSSPFISSAQDCSLPVPLFVTGECFMTISHGSTFKYLSHISRADLVGPVRGNMGAALLPGSDRVLDRPSNSLVPCTIQRCPHASQYQQADGSWLLVNHSPGFEAILTTINAQSTPELRFFSYSVLSYSVLQLASAGVLDALVLDPDSGRQQGKPGAGHASPITQQLPTMTSCVACWLPACAQLPAIAADSLPTRLSQLDVRRWVAAGFQADDAARFLAAHRASLQHPNMHVQIRIPGASAFLSTAGNMVLKITTQQQDHERVMAEAAASLTTSFTRLFGYNTSLFRTWYWASLNRQLSQPPPPSPPSLTSPPLPSAARSQEPGQWGAVGGMAGLIALVVGLGATLMVAVAALLVSCCCPPPTCLVLQASPEAAVGPAADLAPGPGCRAAHLPAGHRHPGVIACHCFCSAPTLLPRPIRTYRRPLGPPPLAAALRSSTWLWDSLAPEVMNMALKLHNDCLRTLAADHQGYESVWEGDSFVIAFPHPAPALRFAAAVQQALLLLDWPSALLATPPAAVLWMAPQRKTRAQQGQPPPGLPSVSSSQPSLLSGTLASMLSTQSRAALSLRSPQLQIGHSLSTILHRRQLAPPQAHHQMLRKCTLQFEPEGKPDEGSSSGDLGAACASAPAAARQELALPCVHSALLATEAAAAGPPSRGLMATPAAHPHLVPISLPQDYTSCLSRSTSHNASTSTAPSDTIIRVTLQPLAQLTPTALDSPPPPPLTERRGAVGPVATVGVGSTTAASALLPAPGQAQLAKSPAQQPPQTSLAAAPSWQLDAKAQTLCGTVHASYAVPGLVSGDHDNLADIASGRLAKKATHVRDSGLTSSDSSSKRFTPNTSRTRVSKCKSAMSLRPLNLPQLPHITIDETANETRQPSAAFGALSLPMALPKQASLSSSAFAALSSPMAQPEDVSLSAAITSEIGGSAAHTLGTLWSSKWRPCLKTTTARPAGAVLVWRGLRVRMGMHCGLACAAHSSYNRIMARQVYSGPLRSVSAAVADAAQGGQVLLSHDCVNALLVSGGSKAGEAAGELPPECKLYHWGYHRLSGTTEQRPAPATQIVAMLPKPLAARLAVLPLQLRKSECLLPGVWAAPVPRQLGNNQGCGAYLVGLQLAGAGALLAWNLPLTVAALQAVQQLMHECAAQMADGRAAVVVEDELSALCGISTPAKRPSQQLLRSATSFVSSIAMKMSATDKTPTALENRPSAYEERATRTPDGIRASSANTSSSRQQATHDRQRLTRRLSALRSQPKDVQEPCIVALPSASQPIYVVLACRSAHAALSLAFTLRQRLLDMDWPSEMLMHELCEEVHSAWRAPRDVALSPTSASHSPRLIQHVRVACEPARRAGGPHVFAASMLRGIRLRAVVAEVPGGACKVATNSTGRPVYNSRALRQVHELLRQAGPGQVLVTRAVMAECQHVLPSPTH
ncbi:hypothetical protein QJQ45_017401 [Haematococcus lacustris]|nr:hypothetical protein QJQ45_017401 [Haematococcus lacustris]